MRFVVDKNIPLVEKAFGAFGHVEAIETAKFSREAVREADVIIVRSETRVGRSLIEGSPVKFVGTATIGVDHIETEYLASKGIEFASAPGCNSNSVKEYVAAALLHVASERGLTLRGKTIGVIGVGNVGSKVVKAAEALGMTVLQNDPPLARQTGEKRFVPLDELMAADILTLHVPLTRTGPDTTYHLFNRELFRRLKPGTAFINTSRGAVVETDALKEAIAEKRLSNAVLDVWENEPAIDAELLSVVTLGTAHIAGYSMEGKINALCAVREAFCRQFKIPSSWKVPEWPGTPAVTDISVNADGLPEEMILGQIVKQSYDIAFDDAQLRRMLTFADARRAEYFMKLRAGYRMRREFSNVTVHLPAAHASLKESITALGFTCVPVQDKF
jgi:erythronate-4-phosphate dehydrogenase